LALIAFALGALAAGGGVWWGSRQAGRGARLLVTSQPAGASVEVDGKRWAETTPTAVAALGPGWHRVRVAAEGHDGVEQMVSLAPDARGHIEVALPAVQRQVDVRSIPAGALV